MMNFTQLGLPPDIVTAVTAKGYLQPSAIQAQAIPVILRGQDVMAAAQTGTGKTAAFTLPLLQRLNEAHKPQATAGVRALILTPTRELAAQVGESVQTYGQHLPLRSAVIFGGVKIKPQISRLQKGVDILIATPGRLLDLAQQGCICLKQLEILVLDEADRMLDMGFIDDIHRILALLPKQRQNLLFSATFSKAIRQLAKGIVHQAVEISTTPRNSTAKTVKQWLHPVDKKQKPALLVELITQHQWQQVLVFSRTKRGANQLSTFLLDHGINAAAIHGNKSQNARTRALAAFKSGELSVLVATDIAARGLDIDQLPQVVNMDLPNVAEDYVHRIGRTGRAGRQGLAISLVSADEVEQLRSIEQLIQKPLLRKFVDGFEPIHDVPLTQTKPRPKARPASKKTTKTQAPASLRKNSQNQRPQRGGKTRNNKHRSRTGQ